MTGLLAVKAAPFRRTAKRPSLPKLPKGLKAEFERPLFVSGDVCGNLVSIAMLAVTLGLLVLTIHAGALFLIYTYLLAVPGNLAFRP